MYKKLQFANVLKMRSAKLRCFLMCILIIQDTHEAMFMRTIVAYGLPFYKIMLSLGICKDHVLFKERKIWQAVRLNRILDIHYVSSDDTYKVSRVEISLVINNTDCSAVSDRGTGHHELSATLFLPLNHGIIFYQLIIFTCSVPLSESAEEQIIVTDTMGQLSPFEEAYFLSSNHNETDMKK